MLISDPRVASIPVTDSGEPVVDIAGTPRVHVDDRYEDATGAWRSVRSGVMERLGHVATSLPVGIDLLLVEGYRPAAVQKRYFTE